VLFLPGPGPLVRSSEQGVSIAAADTWVLLSDFETGSNETPLSEGGNWAPGLTDIGDFAKTGGAIYDASGGATGAQWTPAIYGPDCGVRATLRTGEWLDTTDGEGGAAINVALRGTGTYTSSHCYYADAIYIGGSGIEFQIARYDGSTGLFHVLTSSTPAVTTVGGVQIVAVGTVLTMSVMTSPGVWTQVLTTDAASTDPSPGGPLTTAGAVGMGRTGGDGTDANRYGIEDVWVLGSASVGGSKALNGTINGVALVSGSVTVARPLTAAVAAVSTVTAALTVTAPLTGTVAASSTVTGALTVTAPLAGTINGVSTVAGAVTVSKALAGNIDGVSTVTGTLTNTAPGGIALAGTINGVSTVTGALTVTAPLAGTIAGVSTVTAGLTSTAGLAGNVTAVSAVTGALTVTAPLTGTVAGVSTVTGTLSVSAAGTNPLAGNITGVSTVTGALTVSKALAGTVTAVSTVTADLTSRVNLAGTIAGSSSRRARSRSATRSPAPSQRRAPSQAP
jgi:hypothetical protein